MRKRIWAKGRSVYQPLADIRSTSRKRQVAFAASSRTKRACSPGGPTLHAGFLAIGPADRRPRGPQGETRVPRAVRSPRPGPDSNGAPTPAPTATNVDSAPTPRRDDDRPRDVRRQSNRTRRSPHGSPAASGGGQARRRSRRDWRPCASRPVRAENRTRRGRRRQRGASHPPFQDRPGRTRRNRLRWQANLARDRRLGRCLRGQRSGRPFVRSRPSGRQGASQAAHDDPVRAEGHPGAGPGHRHRRSDQRPLPTNRQRAGTGSGRRRSSRTDAGGEVAERSRRGRLRRQPVGESRRSRPLALRLKRLGSNAASGHPALEQREAAITSAPEPVHLHAAHQQHGEPRRRPVAALGLQAHANTPEPAPPRHRRTESLDLPLLAGRQRHGVAPRMVDLYPGRRSEVRRGPRNGGIDDESARPAAEGLARTKPECIAAHLAGVEPARLEGEEREQSGRREWRRGCPGRHLRRRRFRAGAGDRRLGGGPGRPRRCSRPAPPGRTAGRAATGPMRVRHRAGPIHWAGPGRRNSIEPTPTPSARLSFLPGTCVSLSSLISRSGGTSRQSSSGNVALQAPWMV